MTPLEGTEAELATLRELRIIVSDFATTWFYVINSLPDMYECHLTCDEANLAADLYRALGDDEAAASILDAHASHDKVNDQHYRGPRPYQAQP